MPRHARRALVRGRRLRGQSRPATAASKSSARSEGSKGGKAKQAEARRAAVEDLCGRFDRAGSSGCGRPRFKRDDGATLAFDGDFWRLTGARAALNRDPTWVPWDCGVAWELLACEGFATEAEAATLRSISPSGRSECS